MSNPYEITLNRAWKEWAIKCGVSETVAAALFLISESRALHQILAKLTPAEFERVANIVEHSPSSASSSIVFKVFACAGANLKS
jgi:hypothetical protein